MSKHKSSPPDNSVGFSRRSFLKGAGVAATGTAVLNSGLLGHASETPSNVIGPDATNVALNINGAVKQVSIEPSLLGPAAGLYGAGYLALQLIQRNN